MHHVNSMLGLTEIAIERVLDFLPYPFLVSEWRDGVRRNLFVNRNFVEEIGFTCADIPTITDWFEKAYPDAAYRAAMVGQWKEATVAARKNGHDSVVMKAKIQTRQRGEQWYEVKASISGPLNLVAFVNIHDEISKEMKLEQLNDDKNRILSVLSHDLRSPLNNLHSLMCLSTEGLVSAEEYTEVMKKIGVATFNLIEFLDTTLQWTRANFEGINPTPAPVHLSALISKISSLYEKSWQEKGINVQLMLDEEVVDTDPEIISIVFRNILSNAIKFTPRGRITVSSLRRPGNTVVIAVADTGVGISEQQIASLLSGQYKSAEGTRHEKGFGLGLRLCKDLLTKIHGHLEIRSTPQEGTTVQIVLENQPRVVAV